MNIEGAIKKCKSLGYEEEDIVVDVIVLDPLTVRKEKHRHHTAWNNYLRYIEIKKTLYYLKDLVTLIKAHPKVNHRYLVMPDTPLMPQWKMFFPNPSLQEAAIERGKADAELSVLLGPGAQFDNLVKHSHQYFDQFFSNR